MGQFQGIFKRYEEKYLLNDIQYNALRQKLQGKFKVDNYGKSTICNIYFDTPDHRIIRNSLEKPIYKEKLRLRSYGIPLEEDKVFVELKKKYNGIVYKRREAMKLSIAENYLYDRIPLAQSTQITREMDWFIKFYKELIPAMYISYSRIAMYGVEEPELRVTFDSNIVWREEELWLGCGSWGNTMLKEDCRLMEIKMPGAMPIWLTIILDELGIYPISFSKYGRGYQLSQELKKNEKIRGEIKYA